MRGWNAEKIAEAILGVEKELTKVMVAISEERKLLAKIA
jgi:hypothetical protein